MGVEASHLSLMGLVVLGFLLDSYDQAMVNSTISRVAKDLGIAVGDVGFYTASVRFGGIAAFFVIPFADRFGRRRVFLGSLLGMSLGSLATALAPTPLAWAVAQIATRGSMLTAASVGAVILTEEMPAAHRAWALGMAVAVSGMGYGIGVGLFAFVESLPYGWRALYLPPAVAPLLLLPLLRGALLETRRFQDHRRGAASADGGGLRAWFAPVAALVRESPRRAAVMCGASLAAALGTIPVFQYMIYLVEEIHGWKPGHYTLLVIGGGLLGILGNPVAGRLADRVGRRRVGFTALCSYPLAAALFYNGPAWSIPLSWAVIVFLGTTGDVVLRVLATELFPTAQRGTAMAFFILLQATGWVLGLLAVGFADVGMDDIGRVVPAVSVAMAFAGLLLLWLPETGRLELESIHGERG